MQTKTPDYWYYIFRHIERNFLFDDVEK